jgi:cytidylate kinase
MTSRTIHQIVDEQVARWRVPDRSGRSTALGKSVVTLSREPGSGGRMVAERLAKKLDWDFFDKDIINRVAESVNMSTAIVETLDEKEQSMLSHWITGLVNRQHLWPDQYQQHLMKVLATIGRHGRAVIVGRGANFILPRDHCVRVRIIAPRDLRVDSVAHWFHVSEEEADRRIARSEANQKAFGYQFFNAGIDDPTQYDLVLNTGSLGIDGAVDVIRHFVLAENARVTPAPAIRPG